MRLATVAQMRASDRYTIEDLGIPAIVLMEEAGLRVAEFCLEPFDQHAEPRRICIWAGKGNNGGDGLVAARRLFTSGCQVQVFLVCPNPAAMAEPARRNLEILRRLQVPIRQVWADAEIAAAAKSAAEGDLLVDALLGTGSHAGLAGPLARAVLAINGAGVPALAIDLPSGLDADSGEVAGPVVRAVRTLAIGRAKPGLVTYPGAGYVGELRVAKIGIPASAYERFGGVKAVYLDADEVRPLLPVWTATAHKGNRGRVFIAGGSPGLTGAACLAGQAALRIGAGLVTVGVPKSLHDIMEMKLTEVMTLALPETGSGSLAPGAAETILARAAAADVLAVGPGLGRAPELPDLLTHLLRETPIPTVIDADGLNALQGRTDVLASAKAPIILTPHAGEMARLCGLTADDVEAHRLPLALEQAEKWQVVLVLKGARTIVAAPSGDYYVNSTGGPALATGGSGDVLTGMIAGFVAQGLTAQQAAVAAVYAHGLSAGTAAARLGGDHGIVAGDLIRALPRTLALLQ